MEKRLYLLEKTLTLSEGRKRPPLTKDISIQDFRDFYWLKEELQEFCRQHGLSASGSKQELAKRIEIFLQTGKIDKPARQVSGKFDDSNLSLDTVITENHRCTQKVRAFFRSIIPNFYFSTFIQNYFKNNVGKTYRDVVKAWYEEEERKKDPSYNKSINSQFEYNQFIRDYFADPKNEGKTLKDAIDAWNEVKKKPGENKYRPK
jgi:SAP domain-containing new25/Domain of unknown function (DUF6434)